MGVETRDGTLKFENELATTMQTRKEWYLDVECSENGRSSMARAGDINELNVVTVFSMASDKSASVGICEAEASASAPMTKKPRLDVVFCEFILQENVRLQKNLGSRQIIGGALEREKTVNIKFGAKCVKVEIDAKLSETTVCVKQTRLWGGGVLVWHGGLRRRVSQLFMTSKLEVVFQLGLQRIIL